MDFADAPAIEAWEVFRQEKEGDPMRHGGSVMQVGDRAVVWATWPPFYAERQGEYLLEHADVLFIVQGAPPAPDGTVSGDVALLIEALP